VALVQKKDFASAFSHRLKEGPTLKGDAVAILKIKRLYSYGVYLLNYSTSVFD